MLKNEKQEDSLEEAVSRKDFRMVADLLKANPDEKKRKELALHHAEIFAKQNPRFNKDKFLKASEVKLDEDQEMDLEDLKVFEDNTDTKELEENTEAMDTLAPDSRPDDNPKSRFEMLAAMIGAANAMRTSDLTQLYDRILGDAAHFGDSIPDDAAAKNAASVSMKESVAEEIKNMFTEQNDLSEEFKLKASTLFEAAVNTMVGIEVAKKVSELEEKYENEYSETVTALEEQVNAYLDHISDQWLEDNQVAIEASLKTEITEEFIEGLKRLFVEHNFNIPEEEIDVIESLAEKVQELETSLSELIEEKDNLNKTISEYKKEQIVNELSEGLTMIEQEKLKDLAEDIVADNEESFQEKLKILKESSFVKGSSKTNINEQLEEVDEENNDNVEVKYNSPEMKKYSEAIRRTIRR